MKYPDHQTVTQVLSAVELLRKARWRMFTNLLVLFVAGLIICLVAWLFWPQISAVISQFLAWRNEVNITVNP